MLGRRGFTLVELLAVIVVLAIIMIIAVPKVMESMEASKRNSFIIEARKVVHVAISRKQANDILNQPYKNAVAVKKKSDGKIDHYCYTFSAIGVDTGGRYFGTVVYYMTDPDDANNTSPVWKIRLTDGDYETKHNVTNDPYIKLDDVVDYDGNIKHVIDKASDTSVDDFKECCYAAISSQYECEAITYQN